MAYVPYYEHIVIGCGGIGSAAVYWLSKRAGKGVLGLEQFKLGHDNGGSQDHSRIIRLVYHDPRYTRIGRDAYRAWEEVERESGLQLVYKTGGLDFTLKGGPQEWLVEEEVKAMDSQGIPYERLDGPEIRRRFPQFEVGPETVGLYQADTGLVDAARGNATHIQLARAHGATVIEECAVLNIERMKSGMITVRTNKGEFRCRRVVVTAGAWINHVLQSVGVSIPVAVTQEQVTYFATPNIKEFTKDRASDWSTASQSRLGSTFRRNSATYIGYIQRREVVFQSEALMKMCDTHRNVSRFPTWRCFTPNHGVYGLPIHGNTGSKIGMDAAGPRVTPETRTHVPDPVREKACIEFLQKYIPRSLGPVMYTKTCLYTMTMDRHFVIDTLASRGFPDVIVCCGAGHAYKFASLLGKILGQLAIDGRTEFPIAEFTMNRPAVTDPNFKPIFYFGKARQKTPAQANL